jgi:hypothetical protein
MLICYCDKCGDDHACKTEITVYRPGLHSFNPEKFEPHLCLRCVKAMIDYIKDVDHFGQPVTRRTDAPPAL